MTQRLMIRVSAMSLSVEEFEKRIIKFYEYITDGECTDMLLAITENKKMDGSPVHLHTHIYIETTYSVENVRKILKDKVFTEDYFRHVKGKGHKPIVIQKALKDKELCLHYILKCVPPKIISKYNISEEQILQHTGKWIDCKGDPNLTRLAYLKHMNEKFPETEFAQLSAQSQKHRYIDKVVCETVDFFVNIIEKPFAKDLIENYTRLWLCKRLPDVKDRLCQAVSESFYYGF